MKIPYELGTEQEEWVKKTLDSLSLDEKICQTFNSVIGHNWHSQTPDATNKKLLSLVGSGFHGSLKAEKLKSNISDLQSNAKVPILVAGDFEFRVAIEEGISIGAAMNLAAVKDLDDAALLSYQSGVAMARQGASVGTNWTFAPVVDINYNFHNPITSVRSFGDDVERISRLAAAFISGCQEYGMAATAKHFPGDGMDSRDQHVVTTLNTIPLEQWRKTYGATFQAAVEADVFSIMMGHIGLENVSTPIDSSKKRYLPGTLDPVMHDFLREELEYDRVIVSDAIGMGGIVPHCKSEGDVIVRNLAAGSDVVLFVSDINLGVQAVKNALDKEVLTEARLNQAVCNVLALKAKLGLNEVLNKYAVADYSIFEPLAKEVGEKSITLLEDRESVLPILEGQKVLICNLPIDTPEGGNLLVAGQENLREQSKQLEIELFFKEEGFVAKTVFTVDDFNKYKDQYDFCLYVAVPMPQAGRSSIKLPYPALQFIEQTRTKMPTATVSAGSPYIFYELDYLPCQIVTYSNIKNINKALVKALITNKFEGALPVKMPWV
ncbi:MAG: hypothetical protein PF692_08835 [Kiritimatiellae bacterium]|jgi:beta-N-acetylhexosaminidase|nr:hypothetical protein [Kiritimatiellia bacterium]